MQYAEFGAKRRSLSVSNGRLWSGACEKIVVVVDVVVVVVMLLLSLLLLLLLLLPSHYSVLGESSNMAILSLMLEHRNIKEPPTQ